MDYKDREKVDYMCNQLLQQIDMGKLWPKLLKNRVYKRDDVNIPNWQKDMSDRDTIYDICTTVKTRGPFAFEKLLLSLTQSGHQNVARELENYGSSPRDRSSSSGSSSHKSVQTCHEEHGPETPSYSAEASNNCTRTPCSSPEPSHSSSDEHSKDFLSIYDPSNEDEPLKIKVKKAERFKDGPEVKDIERYVMRSKPRGYVLIITNITYQSVKSRPSAEHDENNLSQLFDEMGFETIKRRNLTGDQIKQAVEEFSKMKELRRVDSAFIIISSHGNGERGQQSTEIQGIDYDEYMSEIGHYKSVFCTDIIDYFTAEKCPQLRGKPKIFIFQMCRGKRHQTAVSRSVTNTIETSAVAEDGKPYSLSSRNYEDTLIAYATLPGYVSYRDEYNGSWFIQILCEVFMNYACDKHIQDLFVMTDRRLKDLRAFNNQCQTLWVISQGFHKHCYLNPGLFQKPGGTKH